jgi:hypothetical protein
MFFGLLFAVAGAAAHAASDWVPALKPVEKFGPLLASVLVAWPLAAALFGALAIGIENKQFVNFIYLLPHMLVHVIAYLGVLLLMAPEALDSLKGVVGASTAVPVSTGQGGWGAPQPPGQPQFVSPQIAAQLAELDAAWGRGGMTPEEYHQRRNAILAQAR